jgi:predicted NBD/HSP70 family sugar kinase
MMQYLGRDDRYHLCNKGGRIVKAARPQLMRAMNEQFMLERIRDAGQISRADLSRTSGLSKNTVSLALSNLERAGLVRPSGLRTGQPGPAALLYEVHPEAGFVLGLDVGRRFLRGAICDFSGTVRAKASVKAVAESGPGRVAELVALAGSLCAQSGVSQANVSQTVLGSPGVYDRRLDAITLAPALPGWNKPSVLVELRKAFGDSLVIENDVDAAALAERAHGHGRDVDTFVFLSIGTGIGMGLVLDGKLHRGAHGIAGEIGYLSLDDGAGADPADARKRGAFEAAASAAGIVRAARAAGMSGPLTAESVFAAAAKGHGRAAKVVADEARLVARAMGAVVSIVDPDLIVLGGGIGQATGFLAAVESELRDFAPVVPGLRASVLGVDAVVDGCLAAGVERAWSRIISAIIA